jgi:hypothetical protein
MTKTQPATNGMRPPPSRREEETDLTGGRENRVFITGRKVCRAPVGGQPAMSAALGGSGVPGGVSPSTAHVHGPFG